MPSKSLSPSTWMNIETLRFLAFEFSIQYFLYFQEETEWQHYLRASIETIVRVSEILPDEVLRIVDQAWDETSNVYLRVILVKKQSSISMDIFTILQCFVFAVGEGCCQQREACAAQCRGMRPAASPASRLCLHPPTHRTALRPVRRRRRHLRSKPVQERPHSQPYHRHSRLRQFKEALHDGDPGSGFGDWPHTGVSLTFGLLNIIIV